MPWILPTLNRPEQCLAVLERIKDLRDGSPGIVFLNGQTSAGGYFEDEVFLPKGWHFFLSRTNIGALGALNDIFDRYPTEPWYGFIGDDEFVQTPGFDTKLIEAAGDWNISHGDDGVNNGARAQGYLVIGGKLARTVGYLALPECWHWFGLDSMWESLAQAGACEKIFVPEVKVDHRHPYHNKGKMDACYETGESRKDIDQQHYFHWLRYERKNVVERVKKAKSAP